MAIFRIKINEQELNKQLKNVYGRSTLVKEASFKMFQQFFNDYKRKMMFQFNRHPVTLELKAGPTASNMSNTLDGYEQGNLFSFIGFDSGTDPTEELKDLLETGTNFRQTVYRDGGWYFLVTAPTRAEILAVTQMPWEGGNSWAFGIEKGISGLSHYMYKKWGGSRSKQAFQLPYENMEEAVFKTRPYISQILSTFRNKINSLIS